MCLAINKCFNMFTKCFKCLHLYLTFTTEGSGNAEQFVSISPQLFVIESVLTLESDQETAKLVFICG